MLIYYESTEKNMSLNKNEKLDIISTYKKSNSDTGSSDIQVALLTKDIKKLTEHFKIHKKDNHSKIGLTKKVNTRRKLLKYIKSNNLGNYLNLIKSLNLRDSI